MSDSAWLKYKHQVLIKRQSTQASISQYLLPVTCKVNRVTNQTIWLDASRPDDGIGDLPGVNGSLSLDIIIKVYNDPNFILELTPSVRLLVGTPLYVELSADKDKLNAGGRAKIIVEDCVALPSLRAPNPNDKHMIIIKDQRVVDDSTYILRSPAFHKVQFRMETFKIYNSIELNLNCSVHVCPLSDSSFRCNNPAADAQHMQGASASSSDDQYKNTATNTQHKQGAIASSSGGSISVVSYGYEVLTPKLKRQPIYDFEDLPGLGPDDEVRIGQDDNKCYIKLFDGCIRLYHKPRQSTFALKAENPCLSQF